MLAELFRRWGEALKAQRELESVRAAEKAIEAELADREASFAQNELLDFITRRKYARNPLGLANAMAGLPDMGWQQSHVRCSKIECSQWPTFQFRVFKKIEAIWNRRHSYPALSSVQLFRQEIEKMPKTIIVTYPKSETKIRQENSLRSYLADDFMNLRLAIEKVKGSQPHPGRVPFLMLSAFMRNREKPKTAQGSVLADQERIR